MIVNSAVHVLPAVCAVVVTYNRPVLLQQVLNAYGQCDPCPEKIYVVDNASGQETVDLLDEWIFTEGNIQKYVIRNTANLGGAGGFAVGIDQAAADGFDWIFVADDDAVPDIHVFKELMNGLERIQADAPGKQVAALAACVINNGEIDEVHRRNLIKTHLRMREVNAPLAAYAASEFEIDEFSYVGVMLNGEAVRKYGTTDASLFIQYDDTEHSLRIKQYGSMYCIPSAHIIHNVPAANTSEVTWKHYYILRNRLIVTRRYFGLPAFLAETVDTYLRRGSILSMLIKKRSAAERQLCHEAIKDAWGNRLGVSEIYFPGKQINENHEG